MVATCMPENKSDSNPSEERKGHFYAKLIEWNLVAKAPQRHLIQLTVECPEGTSISIEYHDYERLHKNDWDAYIGQTLSIPRSVKTDSGLSLNCPMYPILLANEMADAPKSNPQGEFCGKESDPNMMVQLDIARMAFVAKEAMLRSAAMHQELQDSCQLPATSEAILSTGWRLYEGAIRLKHWCNIDPKTLGEGSNSTNFS